jgi:hypothetical protein
MGGEVILLGKADNTAISFDRFNLHSVKKKKINYKPIVYSHLHKMYYNKDTM